MLLRERKLEVERGSRGEGRTVLCYLAVLYLYGVKLLQIKVVGSAGQVSSYFMGFGS